MTENTDPETKVENEDIDLAKIYSDEKKRQDTLKELAQQVMPKGASEAVEKAKAAGVQPYCVQIGDDFFIYRTLSRIEYKKFVSTQAQIASKLMENAESEIVGRLEVQGRNEDALVIKCLLYPEINELTIKNIPAGYIETLNQSIMATSGFGQEPIPIKL